VDQIRTIFNLHHKYKRFSDLKRYVIEHAKKEIDDTCDMSFTYEVRRDGQTPVAVVFNIVPTSAPEPLLPPVPQATESQTPERRQEPEEQNPSQEDAIYDNLSSSEQEALRAEAKELAKETYEGSSKAVMMQQTWKHIRRIIRERFIQSD
jgi:plasmid replication initiation protein